MSKGNRVLVVGVYLLDHENRAESIVQGLAGTANWQLEQHWAGLGSADVPDSLSAFTSIVVREPVPKFTLINRLLEKRSLAEYEFVLVSDDDITLPPNFLDDYLAVVSQCDFALAQPARTYNSSIDHLFVTQILGIDARQTRFVEIGPLFSIQRSAFDCLLPFDEESPMGWGYDFVWPVTLEKRSLRLGIVDKVAVTHDLRKPVSHYRHSDVDPQMHKFLAQRSHLNLADAFSIIKSHAMVPSHATLMVG